jgi:hypothetical protein
MSAAVEAPRLPLHILSPGGCAPLSPVNGRSELDAGGPRAGADVQGSRQDGALGGCRLFAAPSRASARCDCFRSDGDATWDIALATTRPRMSTTSSRPPRPTIVRSVSYPKTGRCGKGHPYPGDAAAFQRLADDERPPCPVCGERGYTFITDLSVATTQGQDTSFVAHKLPGSSGESIRNQRGGDDPRIADVDLDPCGRLEDRIEGVASPKSSSELRTARLLIERLNSLGQRWMDPQLPDPAALEEGVDAYATSADRDEIMKIQVTTPEDTAWRQLGQQKKSGQQPELDRPEPDITAAVEAVRRAIERKRSKSFAGISEIVLALDATDSSRYALQSVIDGFWSQHCDWARSVGGYRSVWMVGPAIDLVNQLDVVSEKTP